MRFDFRPAMQMFAGALIAALVGLAHASVGTAPLSNGDEALINQQWAYGVAGGVNFTYQSGITAHAGGGQSACQLLASETYLNEVDTVGTSGDSVCLPFALQGTSVLLRNAGGATLDLYAQSGTNGVTASTDTINGTSNSSAYTVSNNTNAICFAAKNGVWSCVKGS